MESMYDWVGDFSEGLATVKLNDKYGYIDKTGKEIIPCKYDWVNDFKDGFARVVLNGKYGCINKVGKDVIPCIFEEIIIGPMRNTINFWIKDNGKWGYMNQLGDMVLPCIFDGMWYIDETLIYGAYNNRAVIFNAEGEIVSYENI